MMNFSNTIYTIQTDIKSSVSYVQVETLITKGLYRFTLLGLGHKHASDTKDRVYAALRSSGLLNLKSDNRKILVNISPENTGKKENIYDLSVALSCLFCIHKTILSETILVIGELSITGNILGTNRIFQAIYTAYASNISLIVCSTTDFLTLDACVVDDLQRHGIHILHSNTLKDIFINIQKYTPASFKEGIFLNKAHTYNSKPLLNSIDQPIHLKDMNTLVAAMYIGLCGGHNICIETQSYKEFTKLYKNTYTYEPKLSFGQIAYHRYTHRSQDTDVFQGILYIENLKSHHSGFNKFIENKYNSMIATHTVCVCGYQEYFFNTNTQNRRCICSKKSIIQHKRHIEDAYYPFFSIKTSFNYYTDQNKSSVLSTHDIEKIHKQIDILRTYQLEEYVENLSISNKERLFFPDNRYLNEYTDVQVLEKNLDIQAREIWKNSTQDERCLKVALTIQNILDFEKKIKIKPAISKQALLLSLSYIPKMDF